MPKIDQVGDEGKKKPSTHVSLPKDLLRKTISPGETPAPKELAGGVFLPSAVKEDPLVVREIAKKAVDQWKEWNNLPSGLDAVTNALGGPNPVQRETPPEAVSGASEVLRLPPLNKRVLSSLAGRRDLGLEYRNLGVLAVCSGWGVRHLELMVSDLNPQGLVINYDADRVLEMLQGADVQAVIPLYGNNPTVADVRNFLGFRSRIQGALGSGVRVLMGGVLDASPQGVDMQLFEVNPAHEAAIPHLLDECERISSDYVNRSKAMAGELKDTKVTSTNPGEDSIKYAYERIEAERVKLASGFVQMAFGDEMSSETVRTRLNMSIDRLRKSSKTGLSKKTHEIMLATARMAVDIMVLNKMIFNPKYMLQVSLEADEIARVQGLPPPFEAQDLRLTLDEFDAYNADKLKVALASEEGRCVGWFVTHVRDGQRVLEFERPALRSKSFLSADFDESFVVEMLGRGLVEPHVFMAYDGYPTGDDLKNYLAAVSRIRERTGGEASNTPIHLAAMKSRGKFEAFFEACTLNPQASDELGNLRKLVDIVECDFTARAQERYSKTVSESEATKGGLPPDEIRTRMLREADATAEYLTKRFGNDEYAQRAKAEITSFVDYMAATPGRVGLDELEFVSVHAAFTVGQFVFRSVLVDTNAVCGVDLVDEGGNSIDLLPMGADGLKYMEVRGILSGRGRGGEPPKFAMILSEVARNYGSNAVLLKPLLDSATAQNLEVMSLETARNLTRHADQLNPILLNLNSRRLLRTEETDRRLCMIVARCAERELVCDDVIPPHLNNPSDVRIILESVFKGELAGLGLSGLREDVSKRLDETTGRSAEELLGDARLLEVHCDIVASALIGGILSASRVAFKEASELRKLQSSPDKELSRRFQQLKGRDRITEFKEAKGREAQEKKALAQRLNDVTSQLKPDDDTPLIKNEVLAEAVGGVTRGRGEVSVEEVNALAKDFGMEEQARKMFEGALEASLDRAVQVVMEGHEPVFFIAMAKSIGAEEKATKMLGKALAESLKKDVAQIREKEKALKARIPNAGDKPLEKAIEDAEADAAQKRIEEERARNEQLVSEAVQAFSEGQKELSEVAAKAKDLGLQDEASGMLKPVLAARLKGEVEKLKAGEEALRKRVPDAGEKPLEEAIEDALRKKAEEEEERARKQRALSENVEAFAQGRVEVSEVAVMAKAFGMEAEAGKMFKPVMAGKLSAELEKLRASEKALRARVPEAGEKPLEKAIKDAQRKKVEADARQRHMQEQKLAEAHAKELARYVSELTGRIKFDKQASAIWESTCASLNATRYSDSIEGIAKKLAVAKIIIALEANAQQDARDTVKQYAHVFNHPDAAEGLLHHSRKTILNLAGRSISDADLPALARECVLADSLSGLIGRESGTGASLDSQAFDIDGLAEKKLTPEQKKKYDLLVQTYGKIVKTISEG